LKLNFLVFSTLPIGGTRSNDIRSNAPACRVYLFAAAPAANPLRNTNAVASLRAKGD
jgi:hypothetical protein